MLHDFCSDPFCDPYTWTALSATTARQHAGDVRRAGNHDDYVSETICRRRKQDTDACSRASRFGSPDLPKGSGEDATLAVYRAATEDFHADADPELADHLLWLREDIRDPVFNALARARFALFRTAILERLPPVRLPREEVARLLDAQLHGVLMQWAIEPKGSLTDYVIQSVAAVLRLAAG